MATGPQTVTGSPAPSGGSSHSEGQVLVNRSLAPKQGGITFKSEGQEGGRYHSRVLHVPSGSSGLTIGRGYDMKEKKEHQIIKDLTDAGVSAENAKLIATANGKRGASAKKFIEDNKLDKFEIGSDTQVKLFAISYSREEAEVLRISQKADVVKKYGKVDFKKIDPALRDLMVDLKFRGDYTPSSRALLQKAFVENDLATVQSIVGNKANWKNVPKDRFDSRKQLIDNAVKAQANIRLASDVRKQTGS